MKPTLMAVIIICIAIFSINYAHSQEIGLATFQEIAQVIVDKSISQNVIASITLQSTSIQEIKIPAELEQKIRENDKIMAITITNQNQCILGVNNESCVVINVKRDPEDKNFLQIQNSTRTVANTVINDINQAFDIKAEFHSTFIHTSDQTSTALETSGIVSGKGTVSAVYTMPMEDTSSMYEKMSAMLIPKVIRDAGGFYDVAKNLSTHENSKMTFSILPTKNKSLLQLRVSENYPERAPTVEKINPLEFLDIKELKRSEYFSGGFYPLNSLLQIVVLSPEETRISQIQGNVIPTEVIDGEKMPIEITKSGWVFDPEEGTRIQGKYIFGKESAVPEKDLIFSLGDEQIQTQKQDNELGEMPIVIIIVIIAGAAAAFYLKGYKK